MKIGTNAWFVFFFTFSLFFINPLNLSGNRMEMSQYMCSHIIKECYYNVTCVLLHWSHFWNADYVFYVCKGSVKGIFLHDNFLFWIEKFFKYLFKSNRSITQAQMVIFNKKKISKIYCIWTDFSQPGLSCMWYRYLHPTKFIFPYSCLKANHTIKLITQISNPSIIPQITQHITKNYVYCKLSSQNL